MRWLDATAGAATARSENGLPLEIDARGALLGKAVPADMVFVDGIELGDPTDVALRDRRELSKDGIMFVVATVSDQEGNTLAPPEVVLRGVPLTEPEQTFVDAVRLSTDGRAVRVS